MITYLRRDYGDCITIVRMVTTDSLSVAGSANYLLNQLPNIIAANNGAFTWLPNDVVLVNGSDGFGFFSLSANLQSLVAIGSGVQQISVPITAAQIDGMYAAPVFLVPAPAAGTINLVQSAVWNIVYGGTPFAGGGAIQLQYENTVHGAGVAASSSVSAATLIAATSNQSLLFSAPASVVSANTIGQALYLSNATASFTGGTATTTTLNILYRNVAAS